MPVIQEVFCEVQLQWLKYTKVCGMAIGYQLYTSDAFGNQISSIEDSIDSAYVKGGSLHKNILTSISGLMQPAFLNHTEPNTHVSLISMLNLPLLTYKMFIAMSQVMLKLVELVSAQEMHYGIDFIVLSKASAALHQIYRGLSSHSIMFPMMTLRSGFARIKIQMIDRWWCICCSVHSVRQVTRLSQIGPLE